MRAITPGALGRRIGSVVRDDANLVATAGFAQALVVTLAAGRVSFHYDESVTVAAFVRHGWTTPFTRVWVHNNHPLFSFLEHLVWRLGGNSELAFRVVPALLFAVAVALLAHWTTRRWGVLAGATATVVIVTHPMAVELARQARGYSLVMCTTLAATLLLTRMLRSPATQAACAARTWRSAGASVLQRSPATQAARTRRSAGASVSQRSPATQAARTRRSAGASLASPRVPRDARFARYWSPFATLRSARTGWASFAYVVLLAAAIGTHRYSAAVVLGHAGYVIAAGRVNLWWVARWAAAGGLGMLTYRFMDDEPPLRRGFQSSFPADAGWALLGSTWLSVAVLGACVAAFVAWHRRVWLMIALPLAATIYVWWPLRLATIHPRYFYWLIPAVAVAAAWSVRRRRAVAVPVLVAATAMGVVSWPVENPGIRDAAAVAVGAHSRGHEVCAVGLEAMWAYAIRGSELSRAGEEQHCDVLITIGTWTTPRYDEILAALPFRAEFGPVQVAAAEAVEVLHATGEELLAG